MDSNIIPFVHPSRWLADWGELGGWAHLSEGPFGPDGRRSFEMAEEMPSSCQRARPERYRALKLQVASPEARLKVIDRKSVV